MPMDIATNHNFEQGNQSASTDLMRFGIKPDWANFQTTLATPYTPGDGYLKLVNERPAFPDLRNKGELLKRSVRIAGIVYSCATIAGTGIAEILSVSGTDQAHAAGTVVDRSDSWNNFNGDVLAPNYTYGGRDTGYPAGLKPGQSAGWQFLDCQHITLQTGPYVPRNGKKSAGNGVVEFQFRYRDATPTTTITVTFTAGVPSPATIEIGPNPYYAGANLLASDPADPLFCLKLIPQSSAATYDAHDDDPFWWEIDPINKAETTPGGHARWLDELRTNHSPVSSWTAEEYERVRRICERSSKARVGIYLTIPHQVDVNYWEPLCDTILEFLDDDLDVTLEHSNEVWNGDFWQHWFCRQAGGGFFSPLRPISITSDGTTVTVHRTAHGMAPGDTALISGATDDRYNGEWTVATAADADHFTYTPTTVPPSGSAVAEHDGLNPLIAYKMGSGGMATLVSGQYVRTSNTDAQSYIRFTTDGPHGMGGQQIAVVTGCSDPAVNRVWRQDTWSYADPQPFPDDQLSMFFAFQARNGPLPDITGHPLGDVTLTAAPGRTMRIINLAGGLAPHAINPVQAMQRWHTRQTARLGDYAYGRLSGRAGKFIISLGCWAGAADNVALLDFYNGYYGGSHPDNYKRLATIAPYLFSYDSTVISDAKIAGPFRRLKGSITRSGSTVTVTGPFERADGTSSGTHGLADGPHNIINCEQHEYNGPTTITSISGGTAFTFQLPAGAEPASPATRYAAGPNIEPYVVPMPSWGREILAITRSGDKLTCKAPRHGFVDGQDLWVMGLNPQRFDGRFVVSEATTDTFAIHNPTATFDPFMEGRRPWAIQTEIVETLMDGVQGFVEGEFRRSYVGEFAKACVARGFALGYYEFATGYVPTNTYQSFEPVNLTYQAGNIHPRVQTDLFVPAFRYSFMMGVDIIYMYGTYGSRSWFGCYPFLDYQGQTDSYKAAAVQEGRVTYGHALDPGPSFDTRPTTGQTGTPITLDVAGVGGTTWDGSTPASASGDGSPDIISLNVISPSSATMRISPGASPGLINLNIGGAIRPFVVEQAPPRSMYIDGHSYLQVGTTYTGVTVRGIDTAWDSETTFTLTGGSGTNLTGVTVVGPDEATMTIVSGTALGPVVLSDGAGTTHTLNVVREVIVDDGDAGYERTGTWFNLSQGLGGESRYRPDSGQSDAIVAWSFTAPSAGLWSYQCDWPAYFLHSTDTTFNVFKNGNATPVATHVVSQRIGARGLAPAVDMLFQTLGSITLAQGDTLKVKLENSGNGRAFADACRFVCEGGTPAPDIYVDEADPLVAGVGCTKTGTWNPTDKGLEGGCLNANGSTDPADTITWAAIAPASGAYDVFMTWSGNVSNSAAAPVRLLVDGVEVATTEIDQRDASRGDVPANITYGIAFQKVGRVNADAGQSMAVELTARGGVFIQADATRFLMVEEGPPPEPATGFTLSGPTTLAAGASGTYTLSIVGGALASAESITLSDGGAGGVFSPTSLSFIQGATLAKTFTYTKATAGSPILSCTPSPSLGSVPSQTVTVTAVVSASMSINPTSGPAGANRTIIVTGVGTQFSSVTPSVSGGTGASVGNYQVGSDTLATLTLTPGTQEGTLTISMGSLTATFTVTPAATPSANPDLLGFKATVALNTAVAATDAALDLFLALRERGSTIEDRDITLVEAMTTAPLDAGSPILSPRACNAIKTALADRLAGDAFIDAIQTGGNITDLRVLDLIRKYLS